MPEFIDMQQFLLYNGMYKIRWGKKWFFMKSNKKNNAIRFVSLIIDMLIVFGGFLLANHITIYFTGADCFSQINAGVVCVCVAFFFFMFDLYDIKEGTRESTMISAILSSLASVIVSAILSIFGDAFIAKAGFLRFTLVFTLILFVLLALCLVIWRLLFSFAIVRFREKNKILILESSTVPTRLARKIKYSCNNINEAWYYVVDEEKDGEAQYIVDNVIPRYDVVYISAQLSEKFQDKIFENCVISGKTVNLLATPSNVSLMGGKIMQFADTPVIEIGNIYLSRSQRFFKRIFDVFVALVGIILTSPVYLILPILIKLDSEGPVFYTQERYTIGKKCFNLYKFRTMRTDAEKNGEMFSQKDDPRVTKVGKVIRALRLDEIPQFINILVGDMSVVGPRPERPVFADEFCEKVKNYSLRYTMKAGLTGYAQVYGKYNTRVSDKILLDMIYAIKYSFWLDIKLIILTIRTMFMKESTEGVDEETERILNTPERESERIKSSADHLKMN